MNECCEKSWMDKSKDLLEEAKEKRNELLGIIFSYKKLITNLADNNH